MGTNYKNIRLLQSQDEDYFLDCIDELYTTIEKDTSFSVHREIVKGSRIKTRIIWMLSKLLPLLRIKLGSKSAQINFASMIGGDFRLLLPYAFQTSLNYIYMYDAWPRFHKWLFLMLDFFNVQWVFFSSKQVWLDHRRKYPHSKCQSMWLPEALDISSYRFKDYSFKETDVLEFGRIYQEHHQLIVPALAETGRTHLFRKPSMPLLFPDKQSFAAGLADAKIVICVPSNITHPDRAEYISTMTLRYLQAMASKCLILGIMPLDMEELFGYKPIVEIDMENAGKQVIGILDNYSMYYPLIERNYQEVIQNHQWRNRWDIIKQKIVEGS